MESEPNGSSCMYTNRSISSRSWPGTGSVRSASTPVAATTSSMYRLSSKFLSEKTTENVFCRAPTLSGASLLMRLFIMAVSAEESIPPERQVPTATSLLRWILVASRSCAPRRSATALSLSSPRIPGFTFTSQYPERGLYFALGNHKGMSRFDLVNTLKHGPGCNGPARPTQDRYRASSHPGCSRHPGG